MKRRRVRDLLGKRWHIVPKPSQARPKFYQVIRDMTQDTGHGILLISEQPLGRFTQEVRRELIAKAKAGWRDWLGKCRELN